MWHQCQAPPGVILFLFFFLYGFRLHSTPPAQWTWSPLLVVLGRHVWYRGLGPHQPCSRQASYPLHYLSSPSFSPVFDRVVFPLLSSGNPLCILDSSTLCDVCRQVFSHCRYFRLQFLHSLCGGFLLEYLSFVFSAFVSFANEIIPLKTLPRSSMGSPACVPQCFTQRQVWHQGL